MTHVTAYRDYRLFLKGVLEERLQNNARYSLRAFARDLQITPARLSEILNRKKGLSIEAATLISKRLALHEDEAQYFCDLVQMSDARSPSAKKVAEIRVERKAKTQNFNTIQLDVFKIISDWHHFAILELTQLDDFKSDASWIAKKLGISIHETKTAIERLLKLELLELKGKKWAKTDMKLTTTRDVPSSAIRRFNRQVIEKALVALESQNVDERDFSTMTMAIDTKRIPEAKKIIAKFRRELSAYLEEGEKENLYCLSIQLFRLSQF